MSNERLNLLIKSSNPDTIIIGYNKNFIRLFKEEEIEVTCGKSYRFSNGTLSAFVNTMAAQSVTCIEYDPMHPNESNYCLKQVFRFKLNNYSQSVYKIFCRVVENNFHITTFIYRLCNWELLIIVIKRQ